MTLRRSITVIGVAAFLAAFVLAAAGPWTRGPSKALEKTFDVGRASVSVVVQPDASLRVTERLGFRFSDDPFSGAWRDIAVRGGTSLSGVSLTDAGGRYEPGGNTQLGGFGQPGTVGRERLADGTERVVWHYDQRGGTRAFVLRYRARKAAEAYDDVVLVHWAVWGDQWQFALDDLSASLRLADPADGDGRPIAVWASPGQVDAAPVVRGRATTLTLGRVPQGREVGLTAAFKRSAFSSVSGARVYEGSGLAKLTQREDERSRSTFGPAAGWAWTHVAELTVALALLAILLTALLLWAARERDASGVPRYLAEPPEDLSPAEAHGIAHEGRYRDRVVLATLLDLTDRGHYEPSLGTGAGGRDDRLDLVLAVGPRADVKLAAHERSVLRFFDALIGTEPGPLGSLKERIRKHDPKWSARWTKMQAALESAGSKRLVWDRDLRHWRTGLVVLTPAMFAALAALTYVRANEFWLPVVGGIAATAIVLLPSQDALRRLAPESRERQARWLAFARWTKDFPSLSDDPPATLLLWRRILVYAVAFGTAQRVIESGRIPSSVMAAAAGTWWGQDPAGSHYLSGSTFSGDFGSGLASQAAAQSSGDGGSSGGGGGGSSGGGGGGAW